MTVTVYYIVLGAMLAAVVGSVAIRTRRKDPLSAIAVDTVYATLLASAVLVALAVIMPRLH